MTVIMKKKKQAVLKQSLQRGYRDVYRHKQTNVSDKEDEDHQPLRHGRWEGKSAQASWK